MKTNSIRIISTPPGQAPEWVRKGWINVEIPLVEEEGSGHQRGVLGGKPENLGGYQVNTIVAIAELKKKSPESAKWFEDNLCLPSITNLVFARSVCELIATT